MDGRINSGRDGTGDHPWDRVGRIWLTRFVHARLQKRTVAFPPKLNCQPT
jgi:hypothetical protein